MKTFDLVVIGSGAGLMVAEAALGQGLSCALIEKDKVGGTCLTRGCIPSKMMVYPADMIREARSAARVGLDYGVPGIDFDKITQRVWSQINYSKTLEKSLSGISNLVFYPGEARFTSPRHLTVRYPGNDNMDEIEGDKILIAAGARSLVPTVKGLDRAGCVTYETFFGDQYPEKPWKRLVIIGGGAIGCEFAHIFSALGTEVTLIEMQPRLLMAEEEEVSGLVQKTFEKHGVRVLTGTRITAVERSGSAKVLAVEHLSSGERQTVETDEIFCAAGIRSNGDLLDLLKAGVATDARGWIITDEYLQTSAPNIMALGDINGKYQFRHKANFEAEILARNMFNPGADKKKMRYDAVPWAVFTDPQVAHVGLAERELQAGGQKYLIGRNTYSDIAGGIAMGFSHHEQDAGFVKILISEERKILGVHIAGPYAAILLQPFVYLMNAGQKCEAGGLPVSGFPAVDIKGLRVICPHLGTTLPIHDSMVIHPSMNELTAWAIDNIDWSNVHR